MIKEFPNKIFDNDLKISFFNSTHLTDKYVSWLNDKDVVKYSEHRHVKHTMESCKTYFLNQQNPNNLFLAIEFGNNHDIHIGNIGVKMDKFNRSADVSIMLGDKKYWGRGLGLRSWIMILDTLLNKMNYRIITAGTMDINLPMINLIKKSNMKIDCVLPKRFLLNGKEVGLVKSSITK